MKETDNEKLRRSQPVPGAELDRRLLERAEKLEEGRKTFGSEAPLSAFSVTNAREDNTMDKNTNISEVKSRKPAAFAAAAAVLLLAVGGAAYAMKYRSSDLESPAMPQTTQSAAQTDPSDEDIDNSPRPDENTVAGEERPKEWAERYIAENNNTFGYLSIPNMEFEDGGRCIDCPVAIADDNSFYMTHGFDKTENEYGCIFADAGTDIDTDGGQPQILQLYGGSFVSWEHDVTDDGRIIFSRPETMNGGELPMDLSYLYAYADANDVRCAPIIEFKTIWQDGGEYAIFGAEPVSGDAGQFGIGTETMEDAAEWAEYIRSNSAFTCDMDCGADDKYLVLNVHHGRNTMMRIYAKKLDESDDKQKIIRSYRIPSNDPAARENYTGSADLSVPLPKGMRGIYALEVYIDGKRVFDYFGEPIENNAETCDFTVPGEGQKQAVVYIIDPLSSDLTRGKIEYAKYDVDFDSGKVTLVGEYNETGARKLVDKYAREVEIEFPLPAEAGGVSFEVYFDGNYFDSFRCDDTDVNAAAKVKAGKFTVWYPGAKTCEVALYAVEGDKKLGYAVYDVDFNSGTYDFAKGGEPDTEKLIRFVKDKDGSVLIKIPVPEGFEHKVKFEAFCDDKLIGTGYYTPGSPDRFEGITLVGDGTQRISIRADIDEGTFIKDYMVCDVDFDKGLYVIGEGGEPKLNELSEHAKTGI